MGMPAEHISDPDAVASALRRAFSTPGPKLLDVVVEGKV
jgi:thiamine pyrophosphate-dependent acetolactate synthase large subunit-like protein